MESVNRRDFLNKFSKTGIGALVALDTTILLQRSSPERPSRTTDDVADYVAPIARIPKKALEAADVTDGTARMSRDGEPIAPSEREIFRETISFAALHKHPDFDFSAHEDVDIPKLDEITAFERPKRDAQGNPKQLSSIKAMAAHAMRFSPITEAVETRYALPRGLMTALAMQESTGLDLLPNSAGDGGFGLIHMQNATAHEFGLHVSGDTSKVIDRENGSELSFLMKKEGATQEGRVMLEAHDERLNILANVDAAGRMIASWACDPDVTSRFPNLDPLRRAIVRFCGKVNRDTYLGRIALYMSMLNDPAYLETISSEFSSINEKRSMPDGSKVTLKSWLEAHHGYYKELYPVEEYKKLPLLKTKASDEMARTYQRSMAEELVRFRDSSIKATKSTSV